MTRTCLRETCCWRENSSWLRGWAWILTRQWVEGLPKTDSGQAEWWPMSLIQACVSNEFSARLITKYPIFILRLCTWEVYRNIRQIASPWISCFSFLEKPYYRPHARDLPCSRKLVKDTCKLTSRMIVCCVEKEMPSGFYERLAILSNDGIFSKARDSRAMAAIRAGMEEWTSKTCIRFKKRTNEAGYANFKLGSGCVLLNCSWKSTLCAPSGVG